MHKACIYVVRYNDIAVLQCNLLHVMEVCLEKKDTNKCIGDLTGLICVNQLLNNKKLTGLVPSFCQPLASLFGCTMGCKRIKNTTLARQGQSRAAQDRYSPDTVADFMRVNVYVRGRYRALLPQRRKSLPGNAATPHYPHMGVKRVVLFQPKGQPMGAQPVAGLAGVSAVCPRGAGRGIVPHKHLLWQLVHYRAMVKPA